MAHSDTNTLSEGSEARRFAGLGALNWPLALQVTGAVLWAGLVTWKITLVPGMSMDEAWSVIAARGEWQPHNPLSGMSSYTGPFPVLLLELFGTDSSLLVLRGASVVANFAALLLIGSMLRRLYPARLLAGWSLPLIATCPAWLVLMRTGIEISMFTTPLVVLGLYLFMRGTARCAFVAGLAWGLLVYNHLLGLYAVLGLTIAWLVVYRRSHPIAWRLALAGFGLGVLPRILSLILFSNEQMAGFVEETAYEKVLADMLWVPKAFWDTLLGRTVYLRYVGRISKEVWPYWTVAVLVLVPWVRRWRSIPKNALFMLLAVVLFCIIMTVGAPYLAYRYLVLPCLGLPAVVVLLGAEVIQTERRWRHLVRGLAGALVAANLFYLANNFYLPWHARDLSITQFRMGKRSPPINSWHFLPKDELVNELKRLTPPPQQVVSNYSLYCSLKALLHGTGIQAVTWDKADKNLRTVLVEYRRGRMPKKYCGGVPGGRMCLRKSHVVDNNYVMYR